MSQRQPVGSTGDQAFTDGQAETAIAIPTFRSGTSYMEIWVTGADCWVAVNSSNASMGLSSSPGTKGAILVKKGLTMPTVLETTQSANRKSGFTHIKFIPVAGAAGTILVNFFG